MNRIAKTIISENDTAVFISYAKEIVKKLRDEFKDKFDSLPENKKINYVVDILGTMAFEESNPNFQNRKRFMPDKYDKLLFNNGSGNTYDSPWWKLNDARQSTVARKALK